MRRTAMIAALATGLIALGGAAWAQYPPTTANCSLSASVVQQGDDVVLSCTGYAPDSDVTIEDNGSPATLALGASTRVSTAVSGARAGLLAAARPSLRILRAPADASGVVTVTVHFAADAALGTHVLTATGVDPDGNTHNGNASLTVVAAPLGDHLPSTGSSSTIPGVLIGLTLVMAGSAIVYAARRYRLVPR